MEKSKPGVFNCTKCGKEMHGGMLTKDGFFCADCTYKILHKSEK